MVSVQQVHAITGLAFAFFNVPHLINTALALRGPVAYDAFQRLTRSVYQHPVVEGAIFVSAFLHIGASIYKYRTGQMKKPPTTKAKIHRYAGYFMAAAFLPHTFATRFSGHVLEFAGLHFSGRHAWWFFFPYYTVFAVAGVAHISTGIPLSLRLLGWFKVGQITELPLAVRIVLGALCVGGVTVICGFTGHLPVDLNHDAIRYFREAAPMIFP